MAERAWHSYDSGQVPRGDGDPHTNPEDQLRAYHAVLTALSLSSTADNADFTHTQRQITQAASRALKIERVGIWLFSRDRARLRCIDLYQRSKHEHCDGMEISAADYPRYFRALEENRCIAADDVQHDERTRELTDRYLRPLGIQSMLDAPVRVGGAMEGVICHEHIGPMRTWSIQEQTFAGSIADFAAITLQTARRREAEKLLLAQGEFLRQIIDLNPNLIFAKDRQGRFTLANRAVADLYGTTVDDLVGKTDADFNSNADEVEHFREIDLEVMDSLQEHCVPEERITDARGEVHWLQTVKRPIVNADGRATHVLGVAVDITDRKLAQERQALMLRELDHRVKNNLFAVQSLAMQTAAMSPSFQEFLQTFNGRVHSMAVAHEALANANWIGAELKDMATRLLHPYGRGDPQRVRLEGDAVLLPPRVAPSLCMILHELATNAAKYGSLSQGGGRLSLRWSVTDDALQLEWKESNGPPVNPPKRRGFGTELIEQLTQHQLRGKALLRFDRDGLVCTLMIPLREPPLDRRMPC